MFSVESGNWGLFSLHGEQRASAAVLGGPEKGSVLASLVEGRRQLVVGDLP